MNKFICFLLLSILSAVYAKRPSMKPLSVCCDIPDLGNPKLYGSCSVTKSANLLCDQIKCQFENHGFLINNQTLNKDAYKTHLRQWTKDQVKDKGMDWSDSIDKAILDCVDKELRQYLDEPCKAYDVFACTGISMIKRCPKEAWKCK